MIRSMITALAVLTFPAVCSAWSGAGHHVIAVAAFDRLDPEQQTEVLRVLKSHPVFTKRFDPPVGVVDSAAVNRWRIGVAGQRPDEYVETARRRARYWAWRSS